MGERKGRKISPEVDIVRDRGSSRWEIHLAGTDEVYDA